MMTVFRITGLVVANDLSLFEPFHGVWGPYAEILPNKNTSAMWSTCTYCILRASYDAIIIRIGSSICPCICVGSIDVTDDWLGRSRYAKR